MYLRNLWYVSAESGDDVQICMVADSKKEDHQLLNNFVMGCESIELLDNGWVEIRHWPSEEYGDTIVPPGAVIIASGRNFIPGD